MGGAGMARSAISFVTAITTLLSIPSAFAAGPFGTIHVGNWQGGAYTNDTTGAFSHCAASANFLNGLALLLSQNADRNWIIGFANPSWNLPEGQSMPIDLTFDGQSQFRIFTTATHQKLITAILPNPALNALRKSRLLVAASTSQHPVQFDLAMVDRVVPTIMTCVDRMKANGVASAGDFSQVAPKAANCESGGQD
jgi:hypothetical protein